MAWPVSQDYNEAIQSPASSFSDAELKTGEVVTNALGLPMPRSGNFADVYEFKCPQRKVAVKCFTRQIPGIRERYKEISAYLKQTPLPFMVDFSYLEQGIRIRGDWYPVLKMQWVEGFTLNDFVRQQIDKPQILDLLCQIWVKLAARLREGQMAHCDLQHGNVLLVPGSKAASLAVKLVDYDGMCVPALTLLKSIEVGHPNFQHPQRAKEGIYSLEVDRFSHLVIYTALRALIVAGKPLWDRFDNGDNLLFKQADFENPGKSAVFAELARSSDPAVKTLVETLAEATRKPLDQAPLLAELAAKLPPPALATAVTKTMSAPAPKLQTAGAAFAAVASPSGKRKTLSRKSKTPMLVAAGIGGILVLAGIVTGAILLLNGNNGTPDEPSRNEPDIAQLDKDKVDKPEPKKEPGKTLPDTRPPARPPMPVVQPDPDPPPKVIPPDPMPPAAKVETISNSIGMKLALIPAGKFSMGTPPDERERQDMEGPAHEVRITKPFHMGVYEVSVGQFRTFTADAGYQTEAERNNAGSVRLFVEDNRILYRRDPECNWKNPGFEQKDDHPVVCLSWNDAQEFCRWLSRKEGKTYRLPTEAEWEYACRAETTTAFAHGHAMTPKDGNFLTLYPYNSEAQAPWPQKTMPVGSYPANKFGLHDMHGNAWEWCGDCFDPQYYQQSQAEDPPGAPESTMRVRRGGSWDNPGRECRSGFRAASALAHRANTFGFRVVLVPDSKPQPVPVAVKKTTVIDRELRRFEGHTALTRALALTRDGQRLLTGSFDQSLRLWEVETGKELGRLQGHTSGVFGVAMTPDGTRAVSIAGSVRNNNGEREYVDTAVRVWDVDKKQEIGRFDGHKTVVRSVAISPDKRLALSADINRTVKLWELAGGKELKSFARPTFVNAVTFAGDGRALFVETNALVLWDLNAGKEVRRFQHKTVIHGMSLSPDGRRVLYGTGSVAIQNGQRVPTECAAWVRNLDDDQEPMQLEHPSPVMGVSFGPGGRHVLTGGGWVELVDNKPVPKDTVVRLWDLDGGKEVARLEGHGNPIMAVLLTPDGKAISSSSDNTIRLWQLPKLDDLIAKIPDPVPAPNPNPRPPDPPVKRAVPAVDAQKEAEAAIRDEFKDDFKAKSPADQLSLAAKLLQQAGDAKKKPDERYVLARLARDLALKNGDPALAVRAIDALARDFDIDAPAMKLDALKTFVGAVNSPASGRNVIDACLALVDEALADDDFGSATKYLAAAEIAAKKANNTLLSKKVEVRGRWLREQQKDFEQFKQALATLEKAPDDPAASLIAGKYLCFAKGNWDKGLPLLAQCSDPALKAVAKREQGAPSDADEQMALGDTYWDMSNKDSGSGKLQYLRRAYYWYDQAVAGLSGATLVKIEKRMKQATDQMPDLKPDTVGLLRVLEGHADEVRCVALSRDGRRGLSGAADGSLRFWDVHNGKELHRFERIDNEVKLVSFSADGRRAVAGTSSGIMMLFDVEQKRYERGVRFGGGTPIDFLQVAPDGHILFASAAGSAERDRLVWHSNDDLNSTKTKFLPREFTCVSTSIDGRIIAIGTAEGTVHVFNTEPKFAPLGNALQGSKGGKIGCVALSPDGRLVATAGANDRIIRIWDTAQSRVLGTCKGHGLKINALVFSRDSKRLLSGSEDKSARLWEARTGKEITRLEGHTGEVFGLAISADGRRALTASADKSIRVWGLPPR